MHVVPIQNGLAELTAEVLSVPLVRIPDGSGSSHHGGPDKWIHGLSNSRIRMGETYPHITSTILELQDTLDLGEVAQILVNKLAAGAQLSAHRDSLPDRRRYHLPIVTHEMAYWWDEIEGKCHMAMGNWYGPVPYCGILHMAGNPSPIDRIHLVVDFEK